jgi:hypothetical protein
LFLRKQARPKRSHWVTRRTRCPGRTNLIISSGLPSNLDGLLDPNDAFGSLGYTIDIPQRQLSFFDPRESPLSPRSQPRDGAVVTWREQGGSHRPFVTLSTGEQALLDTGSSLGLGVHDSNPRPAIRVRRLCTT